MIPAGARVWIAMGHTDMRKGMQGLALIVQQGLGRNPFGGDLAKDLGCARHRQFREHDRRNLDRFRARKLGQNG